MGESDGAENSSGEFNWTNKIPLGEAVAKAIEYERKKKGVERKRSSSQWLF